MMNRAEAACRVGLFGIGLDTYWPQFEGLHDRLVGYLGTIDEKLGAMGVEVVNAGLVDSVEKSGDVARLLRERDVRVIFLYVSTYALSSTLLPIVQHVNVPVVVLNLQPVKALDYEAFNALGDRGRMTGEWLAHCQACAVPEIASVFNRAGIDYHLVSGVLHDDAVAWGEIRDWVAAVNVREAMRVNRVGALGHYYCGMLDVYSDYTQHAAVFGNHFELLEMCELKALRNAVTANELKGKIAQFHEEFDVSPECEVTEIERAARTACALDALVGAHRLGSMAYYYESTSGSDIEDIVTSVIAGNTLLTAHGVPVAGEYEIKNVQAMKIMDLFGTGGSFSELYLMDFDDDVVLLGHDGPAHTAIAEGRVALVPLPVYHGKPGKGLSIQMQVRRGRVTLLSVVQHRDGTLGFLVAEAECVAGPTLHIGNTNSRYRFGIGAREFVNKWAAAGPAHHCAIGLGHISGKLEKLAKLLGIKCHRVC